MADALPDDYVILPDPVIAFADGVYTCSYCGGSAHDVLEEWRGYVKIECCFCGIREKTQMMDTIARLSKKGGASHVFKSGELHGQTIAEAWATPRGQRIIRWLAEKDPDATTRQACSEWLDEQSERP